MCLQVWLLAKWSEVAQSCLILYDPMDCSILRFSIHEIFQARVLERVAISFSRGSSWFRDWTQVSHTVGRCYTIWATREVHLQNKRKTKRMKINNCLPGENLLQFSSVAQSYLTVWPHESQHARPPCPSPTPGVHSDSCPSSQQCHPAISSSVIPFSCPQSVPASESFPISQLFAWGGQSTGVSALASFLPRKSQGWSPSEWTG